MQIFYGTFRSDHMLADYWVEILAEDAVEARFMISRQFPIIWAGCWSAEDWSPDAYTGGKIGRFHVYAPPGGSLTFRRVLDDEILGRAEIKLGELTEDAF